MLKSDLERLLGHMEQLWPRWDRTKAILELWKKTLAPLDYERSKQAAGAHKIETGGYRSPQLKGFLEKYRQTRGGAGPAQRDSGTGGYARVYIRCVEAPPEYPGRKGRIVPVCFGTDTNVPGPDKVQAIAQTMADKHAELYGGEWQVFGDPTGEVYLRRKIPEVGHD